MKKLLVCMCLAFGVTAVASPVFADGSAEVAPAQGSAIATPDAGSGSAVAAPADALPNPAKDPGGALTAEKAAYKLGWPLAVLAALIMLCRALGTAASISWLAWLGKGKWAVITAGIGAVAASAFNALALGGTWYAALIASAAVGFALLKPHAEPAPAPKAA